MDSRKYITRFLLLFYYNYCAHIPKMVYKWKMEGRRHTSLQPVSWKRHTSEYEESCHYSRGCSTYRLMDITEI